MSLEQRADSIAYLKQTGLYKDETQVFNGPDTKIGFSFERRNRGIRSGLLIIREKRFGLTVEETGKPPSIYLPVHKDKTLIPKYISLSESVERIVLADGKEEIVIVPQTVLTRKGMAVIIDVYSHFAFLKGKIGEIKSEDLLITMEQ
jgi:hypothetical protein